jgi:hypothetical protein
MSKNKDTFAQPVFSSRYVLVAQAEHDQKEQELEELRAGDEHAGGDGSARRDVSVTQSARYVPLANPARRRAKDLRALLREAGVPRRKTVERAGK